MSIYMRIEASQNRYNGIIGRDPRLRQFMWGDIFMLYTELYTKAVTLKYNLQLSPCFPRFISRFFGEQMKDK